MKRTAGAFSRPDREEVDSDGDGEADQNAQVGMRKAAPEVLAQRKMIKLKPKVAKQEGEADAPAPARNPFAAVSLKADSGTPSPSLPTPAFPSKFPASGQSTTQPGASTFGNAFKASPFAAAQASTAPVDVGKSPFGSSQKPAAPFTNVFSKNLAPTQASSATVATNATDTDGSSDAPKASPFVGKSPFGNVPAVSAPSAVKSTAIGTTAPTITASTTAGTNVFASAATAVTAAAKAEDGVSKQPTFKSPFGAPSKPLSIDNAPSKKANPFAPVAPLLSSPAPSSPLPFASSSEAAATQQAPAGAPSGGLSTTGTASAATGAASSIFDSAPFGAPAVPFGAKPAVTAMATPSTITETVTTTATTEPIATGKAGGSDAKPGIFGLFKAGALPTPALPVAVASVATSGTAPAGGLVTAVKPAASIFGAPATPTTAAEQKANIGSLFKAPSATQPMVVARQNAADASTISTDAPTKHPSGDKLMGGFGAFPPAASSKTQANETLKQTDATSKPSVFGAASRPTAPVFQTAVKLPAEAGEASTAAQPPLLRNPFNPAQAESMPKDSFAFAKVDKVAGSSTATTAPVTTQLSKPPAGIMGLVRQHTSLADSAGASAPVGNSQTPIEQLVTLNTHFFDKVKSLMGLKPAHDWSPVMEAYLRQVQSLKVDRDTSVQKAPEVESGPSAPQVSAKVPASLSFTRVPAGQSATQDAGASPKLSEPAPQAGVAAKAVNETSAISGKPNPFAALIQKASNPASINAPSAAVSTTTAPTDAKPNPFSATGQRAVAESTQAPDARQVVVEGKSAPNPFTLGAGSKVNPFAPLKADETKVTVEKANPFAKSLALPAAGTSGDKPNPFTATKSAGTATAFGTSAKVPAAEAAPAEAADDDEDMVDEEDDGDNAELQGPISLAEKETIAHEEPKAKLMRFDTATKEWRDMGVGCLRIVVKQGEGEAAAKARFVFSLPPVKGKGRDKVLLNCAVFKGMRMDIPGGDASATLMVDLYTQRGGAPKLDRYMCRTKTRQQIDGIVNAMKPFA